MRVTIYLNAIESKTQELQERGMQEIRANNTHSLLCLFQEKQGLFLYDRRVKQQMLLPIPTLARICLANCSREEALALWEQAQEQEPA